MGNVPSSSHVCGRNQPRRSTSDTNQSQERIRSRHCFMRRSARPTTGAAEASTSCCCPPPSQRLAQAPADTRCRCLSPPSRPAAAPADIRGCCPPPSQRTSPAPADTRGCCPPPSQRSAPAPSQCQVYRGPPQRDSGSNIFHGTHRNSERNRSRHCFMSRSQRPATVNEETCCCCPPPSQAPRPRQRCCYPMPNEEPAPVRQNVCCSSGSKPQRRFNCPTYGGGGRAAPSGKESHPDAYPVPPLLRNKTMCLHPLGARCNFEDPKEDFNEFPRAAAPPPEPHVPYKPDPSLTLSESGSVKSFRPAVQAINENSKEPEDQYYAQPAQNSRLHERDALANFDLNRFDRDATHRGGGGRRRNVSIRTCVDYDYEPDYSTRERPHHPQGPPRYQPARAYPPPAHSPPAHPPPAHPPPAHLPTHPPAHPPPANAARYRPAPSYPQPQIPPRGPPGPYESQDFEFVKCPYR